MEQHAPSAQKLPAGLAGVLNTPEGNRDSAYYSSTDASSKHNSAASGVHPSNHASTAPNPHIYRGPPSHLDKTPSPTTAAHMLPQPQIVSPTTSSMSVASMVSPTSPNRADDLRRLTIDRPQSLESAPPSASLSAAAEYDHMARRESVDSRINQGFGELRLGTSPYATHNHSTTSVHNTFQAQQRQPRNTMDSLSVHRISNGYQPNAERNPDPHSKVTRTAPAITGPATSQIARAAEPTKGQAWAFPEEEIQRIPTVSTSHSLVDSRRSSVADSLASSQFTTESRLPSGQRRFDDPAVHQGQHNGEVDYHNGQRLSGASGEYPTTHHHALQHKQLDDLQSESGSIHAGSQPYSRTPELRISHKLAERKRRTEMKELFEQLRDLMPQERGSKASKWEILTKAITEHQRLQDVLRNTQQHQSGISAEMASMKNELHALRAENQQLRSDMASFQSNGGHANGMSDPYARGPQSARPELPPLRSLSSGLPPPTSQPESMTGVQYDQSRMNGYRQPERY
ncbi:hlh transcription factor [Ophiostoma piceae UAMH 11346]|uniref:Hlh transcription factor n=1 Tax=Ophiostoma piceae (strain UAMH 11346) TaxID=1262450 RepID=S3C8H5_OPHP1|nr:hlh transcription factor [Ophiostoma piceae UAMH 11346]